jgi:outer membrane protein
MKMNKTITTLFFAFAIVCSLSAQKFGYVNSAELIRSLPEVKTADAQLESYQKELFTKGEQMVKAFETDYAAYMAKVNSGELSQLQMQKDEARLTAEQQKLQQYEQEVQQLLGQKKQTLYQPILDKVQKVVDQVGKDMGYTMIFDTSGGGLVFVEDGSNLLETIKAKL